MKPLVILSIMACVLPLNLKADTIDYWHVYYNNTMIHDFNGWKEKVVVLKLSTIKKSDYLGVKYFKDMLCHSCINYLTIEKKETKRLKSEEGQGTGNLIKIPLSSLMKHFKDTGQREYNVYYVEKRGEEKRRYFVFSLKLE